jgi:putative ABC transport system permease protein
LAQYQGYADISSGIGIVVVGLASAIIGEVFFGRRSV